MFGKVSFGSLSESYDFPARLGRHGPPAFKLSMAHYGWKAHCLSPGSKVVDNPPDDHRAIDPNPPTGPQ